ncbi:MAG: Ni/Fe hydrogenase [Gallionellales bacterium RIFCSPLOWO2_12_FULL_59_22]|nr:MAG: Ni/Fe hydrogenase [Gallionellales bacterium RIFCSPLOWO2_02_FULL_59_110]OGT03591.1 MAG: Ni/Fe hydrogenase [Gallionellales bacterium RIFCSPLOWO2_02_58_13]OGT14755.1 MAG: Ni/Fe hydrogenase [Gallionellales bacterium RIFCSPLOWO2_12_FULL_59_22]
MKAPILIFAVGNESRGDDALAPLLVRSLEGSGGTAGRVELVEDYQLQVEHVTDLLDRCAVLFVDADMSCIEPFHFSEIAAAHDHSYTSHAMTPFALLHTYRQVYGSDAPPAFLLRIRGYDFELGNPLSGRATANLAAAEEQIRALCADGDAQRWRLRLTGT